MTLASWQDYTRLRPFPARLGGLDFAFISKPGFSNWNALSPSARLLAEYTYLPKEGRLLFLGSGHAAAAIALSYRFPLIELWLHDLNQIAVQAARSTLLHNHLETVRWHEQIDLPAGLYGMFDVVLIDLPKGRGLARRWLFQAFLALRPQGTCFIAGANREGIEPALKDAGELFGETVVIAYKKGSRLAQLVRPTDLPAHPGWWLEPGIYPGTWIELEFAFDNRPWSLVSLPGIFSSGRLDAGTRLLLQVMPDPAGKQVADLGCGVGIIGLVAALSGAAGVDLIDANLLAVAASMENLRRQTIANARTLAGDVLDPATEKRYDLILSNPPFHAGRDVDFRIAEAFIHQSRAATQLGGKLALVANRFIRYDQLMEKCFRRVYEAGGDNLYRVLVAEV